MSKIKWDETGKRFYETGVDHAVLYPIDAQGLYSKGVAWSGITAITETPSGAEANPKYADNIKYLNLIAAEDFGATIEAYTYPDEWAACDGSAEVAPGVMIGQQSRKTFGLCHRTKKGNDIDGQDHGYKLHLIYGALAAPSERGYQTVNDSPEAITFSWTVSTTPVEVPGFKPTAILTIDSTKTDADKLAVLEAILYGQDASEAKDAVYKETTDDAPQTGKTYYTKSGNTYTEFSGSTFASGTTYYEMVAPAVPAKEATVARLPLPAEVIELLGTTG